jgi:hypothetical protein
MTLLRPSLPNPLKYLGVLLDKSLPCDNHFEYTKARAESRIGAPDTMPGLTLSADMSMVRLVCPATVRSIMLYTCPVW